MNAASVRNVPSARAKECARCGYDLRAAVMEACPECGAQITDLSAPAPALGRATATGALLMSGQSLLTRVLTLGAQIVLARALTTGQFGQFGITMAVMNYANLAQQIGVREVLIARQKRFHLWRNVGFWIALAAGVVSAIAIGGAAPIVAWFYGDWTLFWLLMIFAIAQPLYNMTIVQEAKLQIDMRFKYLSAGQFVQGALAPFLQVGFALVHFGAYSLVVPRFIVGMVRWGLYGRSVPLGIKRDPQFRFWRYMLIPGAMVFATSLAYNIGPSALVLVLGRIGGAGSSIGKDDVGYFTFAFNLSIQAMMLLSLQIDSILFPALGRLASQPQRQRAAFLRAGHALSAVMSPICLLQIIAARPIILMVFGAKWEAAVLPFQIMSVGMFSAGSFAPAHSLLQALGRFGAKLWIALVWGVLAAATGIAGIVLLPHDQAVNAAAAGLALGYIGYSVHYCIAASGPLGGGVGDVFRIAGMPLLIGLLAAAIAIAADHVLPVIGGASMQNVAEYIAALAPTRLTADIVSRALVNFQHTLVLGAVLGIAYGLLLRFLARGVWTDLLDTAQPIIRRIKRFSPLHEKSGGPETS